MTKTRLQVFALGVALSVVGAVSGFARDSRGEADTTLSDIAGYRQWARVTEKPLPVEFPSPGG